MMFGDNGRSVMEVLAILALVWAFIVEPCFYIWFRAELRRSQVVQPRAHVDYKELTAITLRCMQGDLWKMLTGWFQTSSREFTRSNFEELFSTNFIGKKPRDLTPEDRAWVNEMIQVLQDQHNVKLSTQDNDLQCMKFMLDPVIASFRPLLIYLAVLVMSLFTGMLLRGLGFRRYKTLYGIKYWYKEKSMSDTPLLDRKAMVLFHGVGSGLFFYLPMITQVRHEQQFLFESPWVSYNPWVAPVTSKPFVEAVDRAMKIHNAPKATIVGHSFGTIQAAWVLRQKPELVHRLVLADPVAILLCLPDVCKNFLYRNPTSLFGKALDYLGSHELGIARTFRRAVVSWESIIFPEMLPPNSSVLLAEYDHLLPATDIYTEMSHPQVSKSVSTYMLPRIPHGVLFVVPSLVRLMLNCINDETRLMADGR